MKKTLSKKQYIEIIQRIFQSILIVFVFVVGYKKTDDIVYCNTILATVIRFGSENRYSMYLKGCVVYSLFFIIVVYVGQSFLKSYIDLDRRWKCCTAFLACLMALGRVVSDSYYYAVSWDFLLHAKRISLLLFCGWFLVIWKLVNAMFTYLLKYYSSDREPVKALEHIERKIGCKGVFGVIWITFLTAWLPRLILLYPFHIDWDTTTILKDVINGEQTTGYTGQMHIIRFFLKIGEWIGNSYSALFIYMVVMYFVTTLLFSFIFFYFQQRRIPKGLWYIVLGLVLFYPLIQSWTVFVSKEANFGIAVTGFALNMHILMFDRPFVKRHRVLFPLFLIITTCGVLCLRMNGMFLVGATFFVILVLFFLKYRKIIVNYCVSLKKKIKLIGIVALGMFVLLIVFRYSTDITMEESYFGHVIRYYSGRPLHITYEIHTRNAAAESDVDELQDILGEDYEAYLSSQYGYGTGWSKPYYMNGENNNQLIKYLLKNKLELCVQAMLTIWYAHFDFLNGAFYRYGSVMGDNAFLQYGMNAWYEQLAVHQEQYFFLEETDRIVQNLPVLSIFSNTGTYIWLMILASVFCILTKRKRALIVCIPYFVTLFGSLLSSYNANIRICLPIVLGMPILLFMCLINTQ